MEAEAPILWRVIRAMTLAAVALSGGLAIVGSSGSTPEGDAQGRRETASRVLYVKADRLFTGTRLISGGVAVAVRGGKVVAAGRLRIPRAARVLRFRNATILPGVIDLHVHATPSNLLRQGVTTTRNTGEPEAVLRPPFAARGYPRVIAAGPMITVPGGYPTRRAPGSAAPITSAEEAAAKVDSLVAKGAAFIKIAVAPGATRTQPTLSLAEIQAIVARAHSHRRIVTTHTLDGPGLELALSGEVDELAHMPCVGVTPEQITAVARRGIPIVGTLHINRLFRTECPDALANARRFVEAGGTLLYGTDIPGVPAALDLAELSLMQQAGLTPTQVLRSATADAGKELGMSPLGTVVAGAPADLLVVRGNPTRSLRTLGRPLLVMARGNRVR